MLEKAQNEETVCYEDGNKEVEALTDGQKKACRHKVVVINSMLMIDYCKRCHKKFDNTRDHEFVTKKIHQGKWEKCYISDIKLWKD